MKLKIAKSGVSAPFGQREEPLRLITNYLLIIFTVSLTSFAHGQPTNEAPKTGTFIISDTVMGILGEEAASDFSKVIDINKVIKWKVFIPTNYNPDKPIGAIYYSDYGDDKRFPGSSRRSFAEKNLIAIRSMDDMTNSRPYVFVNILSFALIQKYYNISANRIYVLGTRFGCQTAIDMALTYPNIIKGTIFSNCINKVRPIIKNNVQLLDIQNPFLYVRDTNITEYSFLASWPNVIKTNGIKRAQNRLYSGNERKNYLDRRQLNLSIDYLDTETKK